jgi:hypothetical protein
MNAEKPSLSIALKTLWGAAQMPFGEACAEPYRIRALRNLAAAWSSFATLAPAVCYTEQTV